MPEQIDRLKAALKDRYALQNEVGSGGMATVYAADDLRHGRKVAVKVLRPELAATMGPERFFREIQVAAQLQHPNILPLLDSGEAGGFLYYVMPLVDGPSLRDRLAHQGELPIHDAVRILVEVVDALAAAHAKGIVHRDIKPDNVLLTGRHALVTDFGVAKAVNEATGRQSLTTAGVALGTPSYMAPEQAAADPNLDHRVDIYATGAMAYEMLTGRPPFTGTSAQAILAAHMTSNPVPPRQHRASISPALEQVVLKCLAKHPADRWQSANELLQQIEVLATPSGGITPIDTQPVRAMPAPFTMPRWGFAAGAVLVAALLAVLLWPRHTLPPIAFGQTHQVTLEPGLELDPALSGDGHFLAYAAGPDNAMHIYVRSVTGGTPIDVSKGAPGIHRMPRWSPDGSQILFSAAGGLYVVPALGGSPRALVTPTGDAARTYGTWSPDGHRIAYAERSNSAQTMLFSAPVEGGTPRQLATGLDLHSPSWSPDGRLIAYVSGNVQYAFSTTVMGNLGPSAIFVVPAEGGQAVQVTDRGHLHYSPTWLPDSRSLLLVSTQDGGRDIYRLAVDGKGRPTGPMERLTTGLNAGTIGLSADGRSLAYSLFINTANIWTVGVPAGAAVSVRQATPVTSGTQHIEGVSVSPDGKWLAFDSDRSGNADIYKMPVGGGEPIQLTTDPHDDFIPVWSHDGRWIAFHTWRNANRDVYVMSADGGSTEEQVTDNPAHDFYPDWSPDDRQLVFHSERTGRNELFVSARAGAGKWGAARQLTTDGGALAKWSPDGKEILYQTVDLHAIPVAGGQSRTVIARFAQGGLQYRFDYALWAPDGRTVYFKASASNGERSIWSVPAAGGAPRMLVRFDDPTRPSGRQEFATDGKRFYFTVDNRQSDIWVMSVK